MGAYKPVMTASVQFEPYATCEVAECGQRWDSGPDVPARVKAHVSDLGHDVVVVREQRQLWKGQPKR